MLKFLLAPSIYFENVCENILVLLANLRQMAFQNVSKAPYVFNKTPHEPAIVASGLSSNLSPFTQMAECWSALASTHKQSGRYALA